MKALIYKDCCVLWRQMKIFLLIILVFSLLPSSFNSSFAMIYAAMLPYTAMAYDERSKWNQLAAAMPYSSMDMVLSKDVLGWLLSLGATVLTIGVQVVASLLSAARVNVQTIWLAMWISACVLAVILPLLFRFGVEKARLVIFFIIFLVCSCAGLISGISQSPNTATLLTLLLPLLALVLNGISIPLSLSFHARRSK